MKSHTSTRYCVNDEAGMTIIELMITTVISMVVISAALSMLVMSQKATVINSHVVDTQQNVRLAMDLMARDVKLASFAYDVKGGLGPTIGSCSATNGAVSIPVGIRPMDKNPAGADNGPDSISMVAPMLTDAVTPWVLATTVGGTVGVKKVGSFNKLPMAAAAIADMVAQGLAAGSVVSVGGVSAQTVLSVGAAEIALTQPYNGLYSAGTPVYLLQCVVYAISTNPAVCGPGSGTCLTRNGAAFVDGIEDIQFSYACDGCNTAAPNPGGADGVIDQQGGGALSANGPSMNDFVANSTWSTIPMTPDKIRQVQIGVVARQAAKDLGLGEENNSGTNTTGPVIVSDHNPSADTGYNPSTYSQLRRRVVTRIVQPRNL